METGSMVPARPDRLVRIPPQAEAAGPFNEHRQALEDVACSTLHTPSYSAKRRHIYRVQHPELGPLGVKEIRNPAWLRQLWFRHVREHRGIREFRVGSQFQARGGETPSLLGAALEQGPLTLRRIFIFMRWQDSALTLSRHLAETPEAVRPAVLDAVAESLTAAARLGLVHGRHSCENILAVKQQDGTVSYQAIDFAYSRMSPDFDAEGFASDASRVAFRLTVEDDANFDLARALLSAVARTAWSGTASARWEETMVAHFHAACREYGYGDDHSNGDALRNPGGHAQR